MTMRPTQAQADEQLIESAKIVIDALHAELRRVIPGFKLSIYQQTVMNALNNRIGHHTMNVHDGKLGVSSELKPGD